MWMGLQAEVASTTEPPHDLPSNEEDRNRWFVTRTTAVFFQASRCGHRDLARDVGCSIEIAGQVLLGATVPAIKYFCGRWNRARMHNHDFWEP